MSILVQRIDGLCFGVATGHTRLQASLEAFGKATVTDVETRQEFEVHMVDGDLVAMSSTQEAAAAAIADVVIAKAAIGAESVCPICDGGGGWPGPAGRVLCKPCNGTGKEL